MALWDFFFFFLTLSSFFVYFGFLSPCYCPLSFSSLLCIIFIKVSKLLLIYLVLTNCPLHWSIHSTLYAILVLFSFIFSSAPQFYYIYVIYEWRFELNVIYLLQFTCLPLLSLISWYLHKWVNLLLCVYWKHDKVGPICRHWQPCNKIHLTWCWHNLKQGRCKEKPSIYSCFQKET